MNDSVNFRIEKVWTAHETVDDRGRLGALVGVGETKAIAEKLAEKKGWYGGNGSVRERYAIRMPYEPGSIPEVIILDSPHRFKIGVDLVQERKDAKLDALEKLDESERALLGIKLTPYEEKALKERKTNAA